LKHCWYNNVVVSYPQFFCVVPKKGLTPVEILFDDFKALNFECSGTSVELKTLEGLLGCIKPALLIHPISKAVDFGTAVDEVCDE
jgi:hypothetical protein